MNSNIPKKNQFSSLTRNGSKKWAEKAGENWFSEMMILCFFCLLFLVRATLHDLKSKSKLTVNHTEFGSVLSSIRWWWWRFSSHFSTNKKLSAYCYTKMRFPLLCLYVYLSICVCVRIDLCFVRFSKPSIVCSPFESLPIN